MIKDEIKSIKYEMVDEIMVSDEMVDDKMVNKIK